MRKFKKRRVDLKKENFTEMLGKLEKIIWLYQMGKIPNLSAKSFVRNWEKKPERNRQDENGPWADLENQENPRQTVRIGKKIIN